MVTWALARSGSRPGGSGLLWFRSPGSRGSFVVMSSGLRVRGLGKERWVGRGDSRLLAPPPLLAFDSLGFDSLCLGWSWGWGGSSANKDGGGHAPPPPIPAGDGPSTVRMLPAYAPISDGYGGPLVLACWDGTVGWGCSPRGLCRVESKLPVWPSLVVLAWCGMASLVWRCWAELVAGCAWTRDNTTEPLQLAESPHHAWSRAMTPTSPC